MVVSLLRIPKGLPIDTGDKPIQMDQQKCVFIPHVLLVPAGAEFEVLNSDPLLHNFHTIGKHNKEINIMQTKTKRRRLPLTFPEPDTIEVVCDVHSWMKAWIIVTEHPYYALTDADGRFRLENVPAGGYRIKACHEELGITTGSRVLWLPPIKTRGLIFSSVNSNRQLNETLSQPPLPTSACQRHLWLIHSILHLRAKREFSISFSTVFNRFVLILLKRNRHNLDLLSVGQISF